MCEGARKSRAGRRPRRLRGGRAEGDEDESFQREAKEMHATIKNHLDYRKERHQDDFTDVEHDIPIPTRLQGLDEKMDRLESLMTIMLEGHGRDPVTLP